MSDETENLQTITVPFHNTLLEVKHAIKMTRFAMQSSEIYQHKPVTIMGLQ